MELLEKLKAALQRAIRKEPQDPDDPYALVGAPKKPRPPLHRASVALDLPKE